MRLLKLLPLVFVGAPLAHADAAVSMDPSNIDIAGVRFGMPVDQANAALASQGYHCQPSGMFERTFEDKVQSKVDQRNGGFAGFGDRHGKGQFECQGPNGEQATLSVTYVRSGPIVTYMKLFVPDSALPKTSMSPRILSKYGKPSSGTPLDGYWCGKAPTCGLYNDPSYFFTTSSASSVTLYLDRGRRAQDADDAAVAAEALRRSPAAGRAAF